MKKKDLNTLRTKSDEEIQKALDKKRKSLSDAFIKLKTGQEKDTKVMRKIRREIAQILTIRREKEIIAKYKKEEEKEKVK